MSMIRSLLFVGILLCAASSAFAQGVCKRNVEPEGGFSLCVPDGWTAEVQEGQKYRILYAPRAERFTANINMKDDASEVALEDYVTANVDYIVENYAKVDATDVKALAKSDFTSDTGLVGIKATLHAEYKGLLIRTLQYYFNGKPGQKLLLTCTALEADQVRLDVVCDRAAKSLKLEARTNPVKPE
jgi:hypothetical protein